jgi:1-hydroxycarotenoid 3,4-desaturase
MGHQRIVVVGAGIGGLVAALLLAKRDHDVLVLERAGAPGGKMREVAVGDVRLDAGPTVFTMRWVFDEIFAAAGAVLENHLTLRKSELLARHAWSSGENLDLFADRRRSADAIRAFAGASEARAYLEFCDRAQRVYQTLVDSFIRAPRPSVLSLIKTAGVRGLSDLARTSPFACLWDALGDYFKDQRLRQLFARYATYCGSSPFDAPATLMLIAHVEQEGVWLVDGGMYRIAAALAALAAKSGATFRYHSEVATIDVVSGRVNGVMLSSGERIDAAAVVVNADIAAVADKCFGDAVAEAVPPPAVTHRSLSAMTFAMVARTEGFRLARHNVFFSPDYATEFDDLIGRRRLADEPTVYVCAQGRNDAASVPTGPEPLLCLMNAPADGDAHTYSQTEITTCQERILAQLERFGISLHLLAEPVVTTPSDFHRLFPATGGALYGQVSHGWMASFRRPGSRTRIRGLYLAGGSTHPGPGVPMAALSGRLAAAHLLADLDSMSRSH